MNDEYDWEQLTEEMRIALLSYWHRGRSFTQEEFDRLLAAPPAPISKEG